MDKYKTIQNFRKINGEVRGLIKFSDEKICFVSEDNTIRIFDLLTFKEEIKITDSNESMSLSIVKLRKEDDKSIIIATGGIGDITIYKIGNNKYSLIKRVNQAHKSDVYRLILLTENRFASSSSDSTIKIWRSDNYELIFILNGHLNSVRPIYQLKDKEILVSGSWDRTIRLWDIKNYQIITVYSNIYDNWGWNNINEKEGKIIIGNIGSILVINTKNFVLEKINFDKILKEISWSISDIRALNVFMNGDILLESNGSLFVFNEKKLYLKLNSKTEQKDIGAINDLLIFSESIIVACGSAGGIKIIQYKIN